MQVADACEKKSMQFADITWEPVKGRRGYFPFGRFKALGENRLTSRPKMRYLPLLFIGLWLVLNTNYGFLDYSLSELYTSSTLFELSALRR